MSRQITILMFFLFTGKYIFSQAPEKMSYQSVIRGTNNALITNQNVRVKISILQGTITGSAVYVEDHTTSTNSNGLVSLSIGGGNVISGSFSTINWENGPYFVKMEADPTGGTNYTVSGTSQLLSVPYALYAKSAGSSQDAWKSTGNTGTNPTNNFIGTLDAQDFLVKTSGVEQIRVMNNGMVGIGTNNPESRLHIKTTIPQRALTIESNFSPLIMKSLTDGCYTSYFTPGHLNSSQRAGWSGYGNGSTSDFSISNETPTGALFFRTDSTIRMTINSIGNIGFGTTSPTAKLHIVGGGVRLNSGLTNTSSRPPLSTTINPFEIRGSSSSSDVFNDGFLRLSAGGGTNTSSLSAIEISGYSTLSEMDKNIRFLTAGNERMRIDLTGKIGIGTATPTAKLDVAGTVKIADGTQGAGKVLTSDASGNASWQAVSSGSSGFTNVQVFSTAGTSTFTVPAGVTKIMIEVWGGGGGGGASNPNPGSPGGGGGYGKDIFNVSSGVTYTVTVGAGGSQGISGTAGGTGGTSSVGSLISAVGGSGGASNAGISGSGGTSSARINISGQQGISLGTSSTGIGGSSPNGGYGTRGWGGFPGAGGAGSSPGAGGQVIIWY